MNWRKLARAILLGWSKPPARIPVGCVLVRPIPMDDPLLDYMKRHGIPVTRENYLDIAYFGNPPEPLDPELEAELPEEFQLHEDDMHMNCAATAASTGIRNREAEADCIRGHAMGIKIDLAESDEWNIKPVFVCERCGIDCSDDCFLLPSGKLLCPSCAIQVFESEDGRNEREA